MAMYMGNGEQQKQEKITYEVVERCGKISENGSYIRELRLISWNGREPKYDIRSWTYDSKGERMGKGSGATFTGQELINLYQLIGAMLEEEGDDE